MLMHPNPGQILNVLKVWPCLHFIVFLTRSTKLSLLRFLVKGKCEVTGIYHTLFPLCAGQTGRPSLETGQLFSNFLISLKATYP